MLNDFVETIVARATPLGSGGICIVRLSGPDAVAVADSVVLLDCGHSVGAVRPRMLVNGSFVVDDAVIDQGLVVWFRRPKSFTGEDVVEFHLHGNVVIAELVVGAAVRAGSRPALPGEFTRRAFVNGRLDLTQVESMAQLLASESRASLVASENGLRGVIRDELSRFRHRILSALALLELELDFVEEGYAFLSSESISNVLAEIQDFAVGLLADFDRGELLRRFPRVLLAGAPNAGKSSFFNAAVGFDRALVSDVEGTTRDYLEEEIVLDGRRLSLIDAAGLRETDDVLEGLGVDKMVELAHRVDAVIVLVDLSSGSRESLVAEGQSIARRFPLVRSFIVGSKVDRCPEFDASAEGSSLGFVGFVSNRRRDSVLDVVRRVCDGIAPSSTDPSVMVTERQRGLCRSMVAILDEARAVPFNRTEVLSSVLRRLLEPLSDLAGHTASEDVLNAVFSSFCIGK